MDARELLKTATPRPWRAEIQQQDPHWIYVLGPDDHQIFTTLGGLVAEEGANATVAALVVNEYEAHVECEAAMENAEDVLHRWLSGGDVTRQEFYIARDSLRVALARLAEIRSDS
jgi:cell division septation protein DedD